MRKLLKVSMFAPLCAALILCLSLVANAETISGTNYASSAYCKLQDANTVWYLANLSSIPNSDDGMLYLYEMATFENAIAPTATPVGSQPASLQPSFTFPLNHNTASTKLYSKFALAVKSGGVPVMVAYPQYITNPELLATKTHARSAITVGEQGYDFSDIYVTSQTTNSGFRGTIVQLINNGSDAVITHPNAYAADSKGVAAQLYALNVTNQAGVNALVNVFTGLATNLTTVDDWVIGNEVNHRMWNYSSWNGWDDYLLTYERSVRLAYNAIKSVNANARVFVNVEITWDRNRPASHAEYFKFMDSKDFLTQFATEIKQNGDIDWCLNYHAGATPDAYGKFWDKSGAPDGNYIQNLMNKGAIVNFENIKYMTDHMQTATMLSPSGTIRHIMSSETSVDWSCGEDIQAAAIYATYVSLVKNPLIEKVMYLNNAGIQTDLKPKAAEIFAAMKTGTADAYDGWAKSVIGISSWSQVLKY